MFCVKKIWDIYLKSQTDILVFSAESVRMVYTHLLKQG
jgi:hypothetical protein